MKLAEHDKRSALWLSLEAHLRDRIELLRTQNDGDIPHEQTIRIRGKIAELKLILALGEPVQASATVNAELTNSLIQAGFPQE